jgi:hypothetical protein
MIEPVHEIIVDLSTSCSEEIAVAKLLGWMKGPIRSKVIRVTEHGISEDQLAVLYYMEDSLEEQLSELREATRQEYVAALELDEPYEELKLKEEAVKNADSLIRKSSMYLSDIKEELAKAENPELKIDPQASKEKGVTYITLRSLDQWAKQKYGFSILDDQEQHISPEDTQEQPTMQEKEEDFDPRAGMSKTVANNFLTTFAFLVEAFASTADKYGSDNPNILAIATRIEELANKAYGGEKFPGQGHEAIKKRINEAMKVKKSNLPQK